MTGIQCKRTRNLKSYCGVHECAGVSVSLMGVFHTSLGLTMLFLVLSALFLEVSPLLSMCRLAQISHSNISHYVALTMWFSSCIFLCIQ